MGIDISHLVLEAFRYANDEVVDERADCAESSNTFAVAVVHLDVEDILLWVRKADGDVIEVLAELASRAFDCHDAGFDV